MVQRRRDVKDVVELKDYLRILNQNTKVKLTIEETRHLTLEKSEDIPTKRENSIIMKDNKQRLFKAICEEYDLVYQELKNGIEVEVPTKNNKTKKAFAVLRRTNWGLTTGKLRKDGRRLGDTTTKERLEILANHGLFRNEDFQLYKGKLHKIVNYNEVDAKYIMQFLYERVITKYPELSIANDETNAFGLEQLPTPNSTMLESDPKTTEGFLSEVKFFRSNRNRAIRNQCAERDHYTCQVCGFNFEKVYGERGKGFIEIHHTKPVSSYDGEHEVRLEELVALCSNCHSMIHYGGKLLSVEELKKRLTH